MIFATYKPDTPINKRSSRHIIGSALINGIVPLDFILLRLKPLTTDLQLDSCTAEVTIEA